MTVDADIVAAWKLAAIDLDIRVVAPALFLSKDGKEGESEAHILDFGSREGAIVLSETSRAQPQPSGWTSVLFEPYRQYKRDFFIETLMDWGWFGNGAPPRWYSDKRER